MGSSVTAVDRAASITDKDLAAVALIGVALFLIYRYYAKRRG